jgi:hypothetical protein
MAARKPKGDSLRSGRAKRKVEDLPDLIPHWVVAEKIGVATETIRDWVTRGTFPEPHSIIEQTWLYRVDFIRAFLETGRWPDGAKFQRRRWGDGMETEPA